MKPLLRKILLVLIVLMGPAPGAGAVAQSWFPEFLHIAGSDLIRNGVGVRSVFFTDVYQCALYLPQKQEDAMDIIEFKGPMILRVEAKTSALDSIPESWRRTLREEVTDQTFKGFQSLFRDLQDGDRIQIAYLPARGTRVELNGEQLFMTPYRGALRSFLEQWLGDNPVSASLKDDLLEREDDEEIDD